jgi:hypothetical protein
MKPAVDTPFMREIGKHRSLTVLDIGGANIQNADLACFTWTGGVLPLEKLNLSLTGLTNDVLFRLELLLKTLRHVTLTGTKIDRVGIDGLQRKYNAIHAAAAPTWSKSGGTLLPPSQPLIIVTS